MSSKVKHQKPTAFYDEFSRKGEGQKVTHYCPGCGHGTAHKLIAEAISDLGVQDRTIFCSPVGCSVFAYYYFDVGNVQCAHGRAPAVATGIRRVREDAIIISYQGDGDLAGIGMGAIVHAANRGENISVFFVNNAIYGMTGGQMAPTTLLGQKTTTTPMGRSLANDGSPIGMAELMDALKPPVYIERVSLGDPGRVMKARRAVRKALDNQVKDKGFSFVEILSPCPVGWKMPPLDARKWLIEEMEPAFPIKRFRDLAEDIRPARKMQHPQPSDEELLDLLGSDRGDDWEVRHHAGTLEDQFVKIAGFGGQGVMSGGVLLANCAIAEGLNATWLPSYGPEMRGGTANASVILSQHSIGAPIVDRPNVLIAMNGPSLDTFEDVVTPGGLIVANTSLIKRKVKRRDVRALHVPATELAKKVGFIMTSNLVALSAYVAASGAVEMDTLRSVIPVAIKKKAFIEVNLKAVDAGLEFFRENYPNGV